MRVPGLRTALALLVLSTFSLGAGPSLWAGEAKETEKEKQWIELIGAKGMDAWQKVDKKLVLGGDAALAPGKPRRLSAKPGTGVVVAEQAAEGANLLTKKAFGDCELHLEFMVAERSNSGVKLEELYEIQIYDSYGEKKKKLDGTDCGGIYPHWKPGNGRLIYVDDGVAPRVNAAKPVGEWQTLDVVFQAPRFDAKGKKTENARFVLVKLNGQVIHENVEVDSPTGMVREGPEVPEGPIMLQMDHGPVAFRNVRVRTR